MPAFPLSRFILAAILCFGVVFDGATQSPSVLERANEAAAAENWDAAIALYREHLETNPDDGGTHYQLGNTLMSTGELNAAIPHYERAAELAFQPQGAGYRLARIYSLQGKQEEALAKLTEVANAGFPMPQLIEGEDDFDAIRDAPEFATALETIRGNRHPCTNSDDHRAFDFWIGSWDVAVGGQQAGKNNVYPIVGDCILFENWTSSAGFTGKSFNYFDRNTGLWNQIWIDDRGGVLNFTGTFRDGALHYEGVVPANNGNPETLHRLVFTPNEDGSVRQYWTTSTDGGETWTASFDGHYVRSGDPTREVE